jgi:hypothetical protein
MTTCLWLVLALAGCGTPQPSGSPATASPIASSSPSLPPTASPSAGGSSSLAIPASLPPAVTVDPGLLEVFPAAVDGVTLEPDPATAAQIAADPLLAESALSIAVAVAVAPGPSDSGGSGDLAVASVIRLRPDIFDEAFYQEWRDTYDNAACEVADGVLSDSNTTIANRLVYEARCAGGAETFHTYLVDQGFIVSITGTGERRLGERIMAGLAG